MKTYSGRIIDPCFLRPEDIDIVDIAHHLSNIGRFNGATRWHYSVAQHSYLCSFIECNCPGEKPWETRKEHAKKKLLHDAEEAYFIDIPRPIKRLPEFLFFREWTDLARQKIFRRFDLTSDLPECVHEADNAMLVKEGIELMNHRYDGYGPPARASIEPWTPTEAKDNFLKRYRELFLN